jgi:hypothetical protein
VTTNGIQIQIVIFNNSTNQLGALFAAIERNIDFFNDQNCKFHIRVMNNNPLTLPNIEVEDLLNSLSNKITFEVRSTGLNLGHGKAHNILAQDCEAELIWIVNPDGMPATDCLKVLVENLKSKPYAAAVEARQLPLDHPKDYDRETLEVEWISGACFLITREDFHNVSGFDPRFFLNGDDVDLSWRLRILGRRLYFIPSARFFHDKSVSENGHPAISSAEQIYGPLGALLIAQKFGLKKELKEMLSELKTTGTPEFLKILELFEEEQLLWSDYKFGNSEIPKYVPGWRFSKHRY